MFLMKDQEISGASWSWHFKQVNGSIWENIEPNLISPRTSGRPPLTWPQCSRSSFWREPVRTRRTTRRGCGWAWSPCHRWQRWPMADHSHRIDWGDKEQHWSLAADASAASGVSSTSEQVWPAGHLARRLAARRVKSTCRWSTAPAAYFAFSHLLSLDKHRIELGSNDFRTVLVLALNLNANLSSYSVTHSMSQWVTNTTEASLFTFLNQVFNFPQGSSPRTPQ